MLSLNLSDFHPSIENLNSISAAIWTSSDFCEKVHLVRLRAEPISIIITGGPGRTPNPPFFHFHHCSHHHHSPPIPQMCPFFTLATLLMLLKSMRCVNTVVLFLLQSLEGLTLNENGVATALMTVVIGLSMSWCNFVPGPPELSCGGTLADSMIITCV